MERLSVSVSWITLWRIFFMVALASIFYAAKDILLSFLLALVLSTALDPFVSWFERKRLPRIIGTLIIFILFGGLFALLLYTIIPLALLEFNNLLKNLGGVTASLFGSSSQRGAQVLRLLNQNLENIGAILLSGGGSVLDAAALLIGGATLVLSVFILSFYLTVSRDGVEKFLISITPEQYEEAVLKVYERVRYRTGRWFQTQIFLSLMMGVAVFIGLWILGVKYSLILAVLAAVFELVPIVGPIFAGAIAVLVALADSALLGVYTLLMFLIIQQMESSVVVPVVMKRAVGLHPAVIILALLIGAKIAGFVGIILAIPTAFLAEEIIESYAAGRKRRDA